MPQPDLLSSLSNLNVLDELKICHGEFVLYKAGLPRFPRPFMRDTVIASLLMNDSQMILNKLKFAALKQGIKKDPRTGEQPGAIYHEFDLILNDGIDTSSGKNTLYAASDTTALYLIAHKTYLDLTKDESLIESQKENIQKAIQYILSHLENGLFIEDPKFSDAEKYALKVTYWKDSSLPYRESGEPVYPVVYPLAHIVNMVGVKAAFEITKSEELGEVYEKMQKALLTIYDTEMDNFPIAIDKLGKIKAVSSDGLHSLFYLSPNEISEEMLLGIINSSRVLETEMGYRTLSPEILMEDNYHASTVWTHEQAQINMGLRKFKAFYNGKKETEVMLDHAIEVSARVKKYFQANPVSNPEIFLIEEGIIKPGGCDPQLWAIAARQYFSNISDSI